jgi:hypothetical protein
MSLTRDLPDQADRGLYAKRRVLEEVMMELDSAAVKALHDRSVRIPLYWEAGHRHPGTDCRFVGP